MSARRFSEARALDGALALIGNTPLVRLGRLAPGSDLLAKLEWHNPGGSVKDRVALAMVQDAEERGLLAAGGTIVEPTAGNTGVGLALVGRARGYRCVLVVPEGYSREKRELMALLGGEVVITPHAEAMAGAVRRAHEIAAATPGAFVPNQFANPANPRAHELTTGPEIWAQAGERLDAVVVGGGSMGTFVGVARALKRRDPRLKAVLVQPEGSYLVGPVAKHLVEGIGADSPATTGLLEPDLADRIVAVSDADAHAAVRALAREEGLLAGGSSGAALHAALGLCAELGPGSRVAVILPDAAERYSSQGLLGPFEGWAR